MRGEREHESQHPLPSGPAACGPVAASALSPAGISALQRTAGNQATTRMLQRMAKRASGHWSNNQMYVVGASDKDRQALGIHAKASKPNLAGATWAPTGQIVKDGTVEAPRYTLKWTAGKEVRIPKDCITTAELVAAWLKLQDPEKIGEVKATPTVKPADPKAKLEPGDILFHVHTPGGGEFHGAAVIAEDGGDVVTLESDRSSGDQIQSTVPVFDMYEGTPGFKASQSAGPDPGTLEETYLIRFLEPQGRSNPLTKTGTKKKNVDTLWSGIQTEIAKHRYTNPATQAAESIKNVIQDALKPDPMDTS